MMCRTYFLLAALFLGAVQCGVAVAAQPAPDASAFDNRDNEKTLLRYLWPVLKSSGKPARVYYNALCRKQENDVEYEMVLPRFDVLPPSGKKSGLSAVKDIFRSGKNVTVTEDASGMIRIRVGDVPDAILHTRIAKITLSLMSQYNDFDAIYDIEQAREVQDALYKLNLRFPSKSIDVLEVDPSVGIAHAPATMTNVTLDQALDSVAAPFKGIVLYGVCADQHLIDVTFAGGVYFDDTWPNTPSKPQH